MAELQKQEIPARIRQARKEAGLLQSEMANLLGITTRTYQNYESHRIPWDQINQIAKITGKAPEWLLHGEKPPPPDLMETFKSQQEQRLDHVTDRLARIEKALDRIEEKLDLFLDDSRRADIRRAIVAETVSELAASGDANELLAAFQEVAEAEPHRRSARRSSGSPSRRKRAPS